MRASCKRKSTSAYEGRSLWHVSQSTLKDLPPLFIWCEGFKGIVPCFQLPAIDTVELGRSSGGRSTGVGRSSDLTLEKVFQLAMKIDDFFRYIWQKFRFPPEVPVL
eukprot:2651079-Rhodomonas_salina.2